MTVQDHVIVKGMKMRDPWKKQMKQIAKDFTDLTALTNTHDLACPDFDLGTLESKINTLQEIIPTKIASIEEADRKQGLFSDLSAKPCPQQIPTYSGSPRRTSSHSKTSSRKQLRIIGHRKQTNWRNFGKPSQETLHPSIRGGLS